MKTGSGIYKRADRKRTTYRVQWIEDDPQTGQRRRRSQSFPSAAEATEFRNRRLGRVTDGTHTDDGNMTLAEYLSDWMKGLSLAVELGEMRPSTFAWYASAVERHITPALGAMRLSKLTSGHPGRLLCGQAQKRPFGWRWWVVVYVGPASKSDVAQGVG